MRIVTIEQLKKIRACEGTLDFLRDRFGETVVITEENAVACAARIDWEWAARKLLPAHLRKQYKKAEASLWKQYDEAVAPLLQQYEEAEYPLWQQYRGANASLWQQYKEANASLWQQYLEAVAPLRKQYEEAVARLFVSLYNQVEQPS